MSEGQAPGILTPESTSSIVAISIVESGGDQRRNVPYTQRFGFRIRTAIRQIGVLIPERWTGDKEPGSPQARSLDGWIEFLPNGCGIARRYVGLRDSPSPDELTRVGLRNQGWSA